MTAIAIFRNGFVRYQLPAIFWTILIFFLSSISTLTAPDLGFNFQDKLHHFAFFAFYGLLLARAFYYQDWSPGIKKSYVLIAITFGSLYALSDELHQYFVPGRDMDIWDFVADSFGIIGGVLLFHYWSMLKSIFPLKDKSL